MSDLAYRHPSGKGKAHRAKRALMLVTQMTCGRYLDAGGDEEAVRIPVADLDPADLCKRCWPEGGAE